MFRLPAAIAALSVLLVLGWQAATVHLNRGGDWSSLFYIGDRWPLPPELEGEAHVFQADAGYDGTFYHLVAHDPWLTRGFDRYADNPSLRWRRILIPVLAHVLALGRDSWVHAAYIGVNLMFIAAGVFWLGEYARGQGLPAVVGLGFLAVPSVLVSVDRLTIDAALAALTVGFVRYSPTGPPAARYAVLVLCPLARETGLCLTAGAGVARLLAKKWKPAIAAAATCLPFAAWAGFVFVRTPWDGTPWISFPFAGLIRRTLHPVQYPLTGPWVTLAAALDYLALSGIWFALVLAARTTRRRSIGPVEASILAFAFMSIWLGKADIWAGAYEFGRTLSPLLILLAMAGLRDRNAWLWTPLIAVLPRIALQLEPQVRGMFR